MLGVCVAAYRTGKEEDSRWLSGTYLLVHPAAKHLGNARVRLKVLLELNPQSSGRAHSRLWQVPQVAPTIVRAAGHSPRKAARNSPTGPAHEPHKPMGHDLSKANAQPPSHGSAANLRFQSAQQQPAAVLPAQHSLPTSEGAQPRSVPAAAVQDTIKPCSRLESDTCATSSQCSNQSMELPQTAAGYSRGRGLPDPTPVEQIALTGMGLEPHHAQARSSSSATNATSSSSPSQSSLQSSSQQEQGSASRQAGDATADASAPAQVNGSLSASMPQALTAGLCCRCDT